MLRHAMCSVTLPKVSLRNSEQPQCHALLYMVSSGLTLEWCIPCTPSCLKFYLCYKLFPSLNSCFTILFNYFSPFLCLLSATHWPCFHFILHDFAIKSLYIEKAIQIITTPQKMSQKLVCTSYFVHTTSWYYHPHHSLPTCHLLHPFATYFVTPHCS